MRHLALRQHGVVSLPGGPPFGIVGCQKRHGPNAGGAIPNIPHGDAGGRDQLRSAGRADADRPGVRSGRAVEVPESLPARRNVSQERLGLRFQGFARRLVLSGDVADGPPRRRRSGSRKNGTRYLCNVGGQGGEHS